MALTAQELFDRASIVLNDGGVRWVQASEGLKWLNDGQRRVALLRPDACVTTGNIPLVAGVEQTLPAGALRLMDIYANANGGPVRLVDRDELDHGPEANWRSATQTADIEAYVYDPLTPKLFMVYPPAVNATNLRGSWSVAPTDCTSGASALGVDDIYADAVLDHMLFRMFAKNGKGQDPQKAGMYAASRDALLMGRTQVDGVINPAAAKQLQVRQTQGTK